MYGRVSPSRLFFNFIFILDFGKKKIFHLEFLLKSTIYFIQINFLRGPCSPEMNLNPIQYAGSIKRGEYPRIPPGASWRREDNGMPTLELRRGTSDLYRRIFGRIVSLDAKQRVGPPATLTPCLTQIMIKIPHGPNGSDLATEYSWGKILAYAAGLLPRSPDRKFSDPERSLAIGDRVEGFIHPAPSEYAHASLIVWWPTTSENWQRENPASFFASDLVPFSADTWRHLPQLGLTRS